MILRDVRALGAGAPLRAGYELSKRTGLHRFLFARRPVPDTGGMVVAGRLARPVSGPVADRAIRLAKQAINGEATLFGARYDIDTPTDWHRAPDTGRDWPVTAWWRIDIRAGDTPGEIKLIWELGRGRHLVLLARAAHLGDLTARERLEQELTGWFSQNPPEQGIHWYSNLELALRVVTWLDIVALVPDLPVRLRADIAGTISLIGHHLLTDLPYTVSTMRNNHLLGDALGLIAVGRAIPTGRSGRRCLRVGRRLFARHLPSQVNPDGSMLEDSIGYHRFVLEMLIARQMIDPDQATAEAMLAAARYQCRLGVVDGPVPQYGDWDEGRVLATGQDPHDLRGSVRLALALAGTGAPEDWRDEHDECAWYAPAGEPARADEAIRDGGDAGSAIARADVGDLAVWLKTGSAPSHGHADLSSVFVRCGDRWLLGDPGTGTYNGPLEERNWFRASVAHNVLRVDGNDQLVPHRSFRWANTATGRVGPPVRLRSGGLVMWCAHDAYRRLGRRVARAVVVRSGGIAVTDWVEGTPSTAELSVVLGPETEFVPPETLLPADTGEDEWRLHLPPTPTPHRGESDPFDGWWSDTLESRRPTTRLDLTVDTAAPVVWSLRSGPTVTTDTSPSPDLDLQWTPTGAVLTVVDAPDTTSALIHDLPAT